MVKKRNEQFDDYSDKKKIKLDNAGAEAQMIRVVTPLCHISYEEQVRKIIVYLLWTTAQLVFNLV